MDDHIGLLIQRERLKRGWDQRHLATLLGAQVRQQAVSGWERGISRPRRSLLPLLARILELDLDELLRVGQYRQESQNGPLAPVRPLLRHLPFDNLSPEHFELFSADLLSRLEPDLKIERVGAQGHAQGGFDVIARKGSELAIGVQVKREKHFGPKKVQQVIDLARENAAQNLLFLSKIASPQERAVANDHGWAIWDQDDLSQKTQSLSADAAVRLVDSYFPGWREAFLGIRAPGPWESPEEAFAEYCGDRIYRHDLPLVGRQDTLDLIRDFIGNSMRVGVLVGRGGAGKTKLIRDASVLLSSGAVVEILLITTSAEVKPEDIELLPANGQLLIFIDDAHDRSDIGDLVRAILRRNNAGKVIVITRPYGESAINADLGRIGVHPSEISRWVLRDLTQSEAESLAKGVLGPELERFAPRIASISRDCPLIAVVGSALVRRGEIAPDRIEGDQALHQEILRRFQASFVKNHDQIRLLNAISLMQPVRLRDDDFRGALELFTGKPYDELYRDLTDLQAAGILLARADTIRIVPDLLGDVVLKRACVDELAGRSTGFAERSWSGLKRVPVQHAFLNACRLDWFNRQEGVATPSIAEIIWNSLEQQIATAGIQTRLAITELVRRAAIYEPVRSLRFVKIMLEHPSDPGNEKGEAGWLSLYRPTEDTVRHSLAAVLRTISYSFDCIYEATDILWEMGRSDSRPLNPYWDHPIRILQDLASYEIAKPLAYNSVLIDQAEKWLQRDQSSLYSPFDILGGIFATEGHDDRQVGHALSFQPFAVEASAVAPMRKRCMELAIREVRSENPARAVRAIDFLGRALIYPVGFFGRPISEEERSQWTPQFLEVFAELQKIAATPGLNACVCLSLRKQVAWHASRDDSPTKQAALGVLNALPKGGIYDFTLALCDGWGHTAFSHLDDRTNIEETRQRWLDAVAEEVSHTWKPAELVSKIEETLKLLEQAFQKEASPGPFVWHLLKKSELLAATLLDRLVSESSGTWILLPIVIQHLTDTNPRQAISSVRNLLKHDSIEVVRATAQGLGFNRGGRELLSGELELLKELAQHTDLGVRSCVVHAVGSLVFTNRPAALLLLGMLRFGDSSDLAAALVSQIGRPHGLQWSDIPVGLQEQFWSELERCPDLESYEFQHFFLALNESEAERVVRLFMRRIELEDSHEDQTYNAIPYERVALNISDPGLRQALLKRVLVWMERDLASWRRYHMGGQLFRAVSRGFDEVTITVIDEMVWSGEKDKLSVVGHVLHEAPRQLVLRNPELVSRLLRAAHSHGEDAFRQMRSHLHASAISGMRQTIGGQAFPEDIEQRDCSREILRSLRPGSLEAEFYKGIMESAVEHIKRHQEEDEKIADPRTW